MLKSPNRLGDCLAFRRFAKSVNRLGVLSDFEAIRMRFIAYRMRFRLGDISNRMRFRMRNRLGIA